MKGEQEIRLELEMVERIIADLEKEVEQGYNAKPFDSTGTVIALEQKFRFERKKRILDWVLGNEVD